jgi:putative flippase GtrA
LLLFALGLALTSGSLVLLSSLTPVHPHLVEVLVLVIANLTATMLRFVLMRVWVFRQA